MVILNMKYICLNEINAIRIDRTTKWGNPFKRVNTLTERLLSIRNYINYLLDREDLLRDLESLKGKDLLCECHPHPCHGDVLTYLAENIWIIDMYENGKISKESIAKQIFDVYKWDVKVKQLDLSTWE